MVVKGGPDTRVNRELAYKKRNLSHLIQTKTSAMWLLDSWSPGQQYVSDRRLLWGGGSKTLHC